MIVIVLFTFLKVRLINYLLFQTVFPHVKILLQKMQYNIFNGSYHRVNDAFQNYRLVLNPDHHQRSLHNHCQNFFINEIKHERSRS